jgi:hypothetical protein
MNRPFSPRPILLRVQARLWLVAQIEGLLLVSCPRGRFRRMGLAWVDRSYAELRVRINGTGSAQPPGD